jgi:CheY-like chemotaxis protein
MTVENKKKCTIQLFHSRGALPDGVKCCSKKRCNPKVVVVDDEPAIREILLAYAALMGFKKVRAAGSVAEAVVLIEAETPCVIISDINMPGKPGTELDSLYPNIPIVYVSGFAIGAQPGRIILDKPFDPLELLASLALASAKHHCDGSRYGCIAGSTLIRDNNEEEGDEEEPGPNT